MIIDHIGLVVRSIEDGLKQWINLFGYRQMTAVVHNTRQKVRVVFLEKDSSVIVKLIEPTDPESPAFVMAKRGGGMHHLCFKVDDLLQGITDLQKKGARLLNKPQPGEAFCEEDIAFLYAKNGLNIELIETDKKANLLK